MDAFLFQLKYLKFIRNQKFNNVYVKLKILLNSEKIFTHINWNIILTHFFPFGMA